ncbi:MAG: FAD-dependent oxidoreductase [Haliea sp.]
MTRNNPHPHYPHIFRSLSVGAMTLRNRTMTPPHASAIGNIYGSDEDALRNIAYFEQRAKSGIAWIGALSTLVKNHLIPGFDPTGIGATTTGYFRLPGFVERIQQFSDTMHRHDTRVTVQMVNQGGMPHGPSPVMSAPVINLMPHVMDKNDIAAFVQEYSESARLAAEGRADGIEIHLNHDDLHQWFLSPATNLRTDGYGGSLENRCRFTREVLQSIRDAVGSAFTLGVRMNLREENPAGYQLYGAIEIAQYLESTGLIDYVHGVVGNPWGNPSYIQPDYFRPAQWADLAGELRAALGLPVVYTGKVNSPDVAESVLAQGQADVIGIARALIADGDFVGKADQGRALDIRPCVGCNECISRRYVEGLSFGCAVNPATSHEVLGPWPITQQRRNLLIVGAGPAGLELAALAAEGGLAVELWETAEETGGQLRWAARAPGNHRYSDYLAWQERRLAKLPVDLRLSRNASAESVLAHGADVVAFATGAHARRPDIPGIMQPQVADIREVLAGKATLGKRVVIIAQDDHLPPLLVADFLAERGHQVTLVYATNGPAQLVGRYSIGAVLGRLDARDVQLHTMQEVVAIEGQQLQIRQIYSQKTRTLAGFDNIVLACGSVPDSVVHDAVATARDGVHLLGDAYAPRRVVFATRQAYALARKLVTPTA